MQHLYGTTTFEEGTMAYIRPEQPKAGKQLTDRERYQIEALKREGFTQSAIAKSLGRSRSTINREIGRNSDVQGYRGSLAVKRTDRRRRGARKKIKLDLPMQSIIKSLLGEYYSPEHISGRLKLALGVEISHETIYKHIWEDKKSGGDLYNFLRSKGKKYRAKFDLYRAIVSHIINNTNHRIINAFSVDR